MSNLNQDKNIIRDVLSNTKVIAVIDHSDKPYRTSYQIAQFLRSVGYRVFPVNPAVRTIDNQLSYPSLKDLPETVDLVNVFRRSEYLNDIVDEAITIQAKTVWAQLDINDSLAAKKALDAGINIAMNLCIKTEYLRLNIGLINRN